MDLDNFKLINDTFGHPHGDQVLGDVGAAIRAVFGPEDILGRLGGDEFLLLMKDAAGREQAARQAERLLAQLQFQIKGDGRSMELTACVGVTCFTGGDRALRTLYDEADTALYQAKKQGKNRYMFFGDGEAAVLPAGPMAADSADIVHLETLLAYMDGGVVLAEAGETLRITYVSPSFIRTFGRTEAELGPRGERFFELVHHDDLPGMRAALWSTAETGQVSDLAYRVKAGGDYSWRHLRAKRIPDGRGGLRRLVLVVTDISAAKRNEERMRETETRYRLAVEQTNAMLWEVDIAAQTLKLIGPEWDRFRITTRVLEGAAQKQLPAFLHPDSLAEYGRLFGDIENGLEGESYFLKVYDAQDREQWLRNQFRFLRDEGGKPVRALGVARPAPNVNAEMRRFEQELRFAGIAGGALLGYIRLNFTQDRVEESWNRSDGHYADLRGADCGTLAGLLNQQYQDPEDPDKPVFDREELLRRFHDGDSRQLADYWQVHADGSRRRVSLLAKLLRHPISGDVYAFCYLRDSERQHRLEAPMRTPPQRDPATLLYSQEGLAALAAAAMTGRELVSVAVLELLGLDRLSREQGETETGELLSTLYRLCRLVVDGEVLAGQAEDRRVALVWVDAACAEAQRTRVKDTVERLQALLREAHPRAAVRLAAGLATGPTAGTAAGAPYETLRRKALVACRSAELDPLAQVVDYAESEAAAAGGEADPETRLRLLEQRCQQLTDMLRISENDELTGLLEKRSFYRRARELLDQQQDAEFALIRFDINRFKVYNDVNGTAAGDQLLKDIAAQLRQTAAQPVLLSRLESDHFALLLPYRPQRLEPAVRRLSDWLAAYSADFRLTASVGVYRIADPAMELSLICDRALLAQRTVKSGFDTRLGFYDDALRDRLLREQKLVDDLDAALERGQFELYFQPQVNYGDGSLIGAEALVRWEHPELGLLSPGEFIALFEQNGLITHLDERIWEMSCRQIRLWLDRYPQAAALGVSVNVSRLDIYKSGLCDRLVTLCGRYGLEPAALKLEITESAYMDNPQQLVDTVRSLREAGFIVEMDDFGSGYSSLNTLKDVPVDILKLDMKFLASCSDSARGGNILNSVIRMAHWLKLPIIAEGVETREQADYLKSLGCIYMQGYYFDRPMPAAEFERLLAASQVRKPDKYKNVNMEGAAAFWDPSAQMALLFNSFVGGAAIMDYHDGILEAVRVNDNYYKTLGTDRERYLPMQLNILDRFDEANRSLFLREIQRAVDSGEECGCELQALPGAGGVTRVWTSNRIRLLAKNNGSAILYVSIQDITERKLLAGERDAENERNRLLMQTTGSIILDYDLPSDTLIYQLYRPGQGLLKQEVAGFRQVLSTTKQVDPAHVDLVRDLIDDMGGAPVSGELEFRASLWGGGLRWCYLRYASVADAGGRASRLVGQATDIQANKDREALSEALRTRLNANTAITAYSDVLVNQVYSLFYGTSDIGGAIETTLSLLGEYYGLSRVYIYEDVAEHAALSITFEWCAHGTAPMKALLQSLPYDSMGGREAFISLFNEQGAFYCRDTETLPEGSREIMEKQGVHTLLQTAIMDSGEFAGCIGFDDRGEAPWSEEQLGTLMFVSRIVGAFLLNRRGAESAAFSADFRAALDDNAAYVYIIEPDTYEIIYNNKALLERSGQGYVGKTCYREFIGLDAPCENCPIRRLHEPSAPRITEVQWLDGMMVLGHVSPLRWDGRDLAMVSCIDITESKRAQRALITEKQKTDLAIEAANLYLWTYDMDHDTITPTKDLAPFHKGGVPIVEGCRAFLKWGLILPDSEADVLELHAKMRAGAHSASAVLHYNPAHYPVEWMKVTYTAALDSGGPRTAIAVAQDVTAQRQAEERYRLETEYRKSLSSEYIMTLRVNVTQGIIEDVQGMETASSLGGEERANFISKYAQRIPDPGERTAFIGFFDQQALLTAFDRGDRQLFLDYRIRKPEGGYRYAQAEVRLSAWPGDGDVIGFLAIRDHTREAMTRLLVDKLVETGYDYVAYIEADNGQYRVFAADPRFAAAGEVAGGDYTRAMRQVLQRAVPAADLDRVLREIALPYVLKQLKERELYTCTYRTTAETGGRMRQLVFRPVGGDPGQLMLTRQDVTELVEAERQSSQRLQQALESAIQASNAKSQFLSRVSHEMRTPLNAILGFMELARDGSEAQMRNYLKNSEMAARQLLSVINDVLDMSSIEAGKIRIAHEAFDVGEQLQSVTNIYALQCAQKGLRFDTQLQTTLDDVLVGDRLRVNQILMNLLSNAVKFTEQGGVTLRVRQHGGRDDKVFLHFEVADTGCGMSQELQARLFRPFEQGGVQSGIKYGGSGLGLSIAKHLISLLGGAIRAESREGEGSTFYVDIPFSRGVPEAPAQRLIPAEGLRVLAVDDTLSDLEYLSAALTRLGVKHSCVTSGDGALAALRQAGEEGEPFGICIVDWSMPEMDGLQLTRRIRDQFGADTAVIVISAYAHEQATDSAQAAGADAFVTKPLFQSSLLDLFMNLTEGRLGRQPGVVNRQSFPGRRVLLAEDNEMNRTVARELLKRFAIACDEAADGRAAVDRFLQAPAGTYDAILMDIQMPELDGYAATRAIRGAGHPESKTIPIIALSADAFDEDVARSLSAGMNDHVSKPIEPKKLLLALGKVFGG